MYIFLCLISVGLNFLLHHLQKDLQLQAVIIYRTESSGQWLDLCWPMLNISLILKTSTTKLTEGLLPAVGYKWCFHCQVIHRYHCDCEGTAYPCIPGVRIQRQSHEEETHQCKDHHDSQRNLNSDFVSCHSQTNRICYLYFKYHSAHLKWPGMIWESVSVDEHPQGCQGDEKPAWERGKIDQLIDLSFNNHDDHQRILQTGER